MRRIRPIRDHLRRISTVLVAFVCVAVAGKALGSTTYRLDGKRLILTIDTESFELKKGDHGVTLTLPSHHPIANPGEPALPMMKLLVALPPGTQAESVEILGQDTIEVEGRHRIMPSPPVAFLPDMPRWEETMRAMHRQWEERYDSIYESDAPFPASPARLSGQGTYRRVGYATLTICPFTYHPRTGRLEYHQRLQVAIRLADQSLSRVQSQDTSGARAEMRAARLFDNWDQVSGLYLSSGDELADRNETCDYLILTTPELVGAITASQFPTWKATRGHQLRIVLTDDNEIVQQPGVDLAERIRNFLRENYLSLGIEYLLLVGDYQSVPMRICYPDPDNHVYNPWDPGLVAPGTPTDAYYADLSAADADSWDYDGDGYPGEYGDDQPDFLAEIAVGRIPVDNPARITYSLDKLVAFEQDTGAWKRNVLHGGAILFFENQNYSGYPFIDGATCLDSIETGLMTGYEITHFSEQAGVVTSSFDWPALSEYRFTQSWGANEFAIVNWSGHGWCDGAYRTVWSWDDGDGVPESANGEMVSYRFIGTGASQVDDDHPSIVFAISCNVGYPEPNGYGNLGIDLLTLPGWGSSAGVVSSARPAAISADWKNSPGGTEQICFDFNRYLIVEGERVGDALYDGKFNATSQYGWDSVYEYMNLYNYNLYGDPSLDIETETVDAPDAALAEANRIRWVRVQPNPFLDLTTLQLERTRPGSASLRVLDPSGREVARLLDGEIGAGRTTLQWDGRRADGKHAAPGLYFLICESQGETVSEKLILLR